ncbi:MAG: hypothetical protein HYY93_08345 [Planctomycetes bacterium]|nr:hypothetical protein [Planctomycetota bacterium]
MRARVDAGTDVAAIGAWDMIHGSVPGPGAGGGDRSQFLEGEASEGRLFLIHTGADGGGPVDIRVDEAGPDPTLDGLIPIGGTHLLSIPTGGLIVDGAEYYRPTHPEPASAAGRAVQVAPGDYEVRCWWGTGEEGASGSEKELEVLVGREEVRYFDRANHFGCLAIMVFNSTLLIGLALWIGWIRAMAITVACSLLSLHLLERLVNLSARYRRLDAVIPTFRIGHQPATLVLVLRRVEDRAGLHGGTVRRPEGVD